jgi:hypothetical protein
MKLVKAAVLVGGALIATPAFAQDPDPAAGGTVEAGASGEVVADPNAPAADGTVAVDANAAAASGMGWWPTAAIDRPYMRGKGKISAGADFQYAAITLDDGMGNSISASADALSVNATYGISDQINAGVVYAIPLGIGDVDFNAAGNLTLWGGYQISHTPKLSISATVLFGVNLDNTDDMGIAAGLGAKYLLAPKIALFTGAPYGPGPVGDHLQIGLGDPAPISFDVPVGVMLQATPQLNAFVSTELAQFAINDDAGDSIFFGADYIPLALGGLFAVNPNIDVTATFALGDLKEAGFDLYAFSIGARWHN